MEIHVILVEDHPVVRQGIRRVLEQTSDIHVVGEAGDSDQAIALLKDLQPDVVVCDIRLPGTSGLEVIRKSKEYSSSTRSIIFSAYDYDEYILEAIAAGASGYILKTVDINEFPEIIRKVYSGQMVIYPPMSDKLARLLSGKPPGGKSDPLTPRERQIVSLAALGLRNKAIAKELGLSDRTIEAHFSRIFAKLSVSSRIEAVRLAGSRHLIDEEKNRGMGLA